MSDAPLEDPAYEPKHPPVGGVVPAIVERWGAASQLRWFDRFRDQLKPASGATWARFYCTTVAHRGDCCTSCIEDREYGFDLDVCCCRALHEPAVQAALPAGGDVRVAPTPSKETTT